MTLQINGKSQDFALSDTSETLSLHEILDQLGLAGQPLLVEHNGQALHPSAQAKLQLKSGDRLELLRMVAGG